MKDKAFNGGYKDGYRDGLKGECHFPGDAELPEQMGYLKGRDAGSAKRAKRQAHNAKARARRADESDLIDGLGMKRVRGPVSGVEYWD